MSRDDQNEREPASPGVARIAPDGEDVIEPLRPRHTMADHEKMGRYMVALRRCRRRLLDAQDGDVLRVLGNAAYELEALRLAARDLLPLAVQYISDAMRLRLLGTPPDDAVVEAFNFARRGWMDE